MAAFSYPPQEKKYKVELTLQEANSLLYCLDKSAAEHITVTQMIKTITDQVNKQIQDEQAKLKADTLNKKPKQ